MRPRRVLATVIVGSLVITACSSSERAQPPKASSDAGPAIIVTDRPGAALTGTLLKPAAPRPTQVLRDTTGEPFSLADRPADELTVLFFGYTHCPDVCPTAMADLAAARDRLPASLREKVTVVFVTEDPERDTPQALRRWLDGFDPSFVGLRGGNRATATMLKQLHLPSTKRLTRPEDPITHPDTGSGHHHHGKYGVEHAGVVYAFGPGESTVIYTGGATASDYAADFTRLLTASLETR